MTSPALPHARPTHAAAGKFCHTSAPIVRTRLRLLFALAAWMWTGLASATDYCIASVQDLADVSAALIAGAPGSQNVRIVEGTYVMDEPVLVALSGALTVQGGYAADCTHHTPGAARTILRPLSPAAYQPSFHAFGDISISDLTLDGYVGAFMWPIGTNFSLTVTRLAVLQKPSASIALQMSAQGGNKNLSNILVDASTSACALAASVGAGNRIDSNFLTVVNRGSGSGGCMAAAGNDIAIRSSILFAGSGNDAEITTGTALILSSVFDEVAGTGSLDAGSAGNLAGPLTFDPSPLPFDRNRPADLADQPARDSATPVDDMDFDILGNPRVVGDAPDRGTFELQGDAVFHNGFEIAVASGP